MKNEIARIKRILLKHRNLSLRRPGTVSIDRAELIANEIYRELENGK